MALHSMCQPGKAHTPGAIPLHLALLVLRGELPERKVCGVALLGIDLDPRPGLLLLEALADQLPIRRELRDVKVDSVRGLIRIALLFELSDERDLIGNVVGRLADDMGS
jgi:hypothetical protein